MKTKTLKDLATEIGWTYVHDDEVRCPYDSVAIHNGANGDFIIYGNLELQYETVVTLANDLNARNNFTAS